MSEVMTILIHFHQSHYRNFKAYYRQHLCRHLRSEFPGLVSYTRFVELIPSALKTLGFYLLSRFGQTRGVAFVDSTPIPVCHNRRIARNRIFADAAARGRSGMGWFYGFKLHLIVNDQGELLSFCLTPANVDDRKPVPQMAERLWDKLIGDRGYISQPLFEQLFSQGLQLSTPLRKNMKNRLVALEDRLLIRKRSLIEDDQRSTQERFTDCPFPSPQSNKLSRQSHCWTDCLHLAGQEAFYPAFAQGYDPLTRCDLTPNSGYYHYHAFTAHNWSYAAAIIVAVTVVAVILAAATLRLTRREPVTY